MHCRACHRAMVSTSSQVFEDEKGAMTMTQWRCRPVGQPVVNVRPDQGVGGGGASDIEAPSHQLV